MIPQPTSLLLEKFERLNALYSDYLKALQIEQSLLVDSNLSVLNANVKEKEKIVQAIQSAEEERLLIWNALAVDCGKPVSEFRLTDIAAKTDAGEAMLLVAAKEKLAATLSRVKALNSINTQLLSDSLDFVRSAFDLVAGKREVNVGYSRQGSPAQEVRVKRNLLNTKV